MKFEPITQAYMYGYQVEEGERRAEIVRDAGGWHLFCYINDVMQLNQARTKLPYSEARKKAKDFVRGGNKNGNFKRAH